MLVIGVAWVLVAAMAGLLLARMIGVADQRQADRSRRTFAEGDTVADAYEVDEPVLDWVEIYAYLDVQADPR